MDKSIWDKLTEFEINELFIRLKFNILDYKEYVRKLINKYDENTGQ
jgi:hypothetical protein